MRFPLLKAFWGSRWMALSSQWLQVWRRLCVHRRGAEHSCSRFGEDLGTLEKTGFWRSATLGPGTSHVSQGPFQLSPPLSPTKPSMEMGEK